MEGEQEGILLQGDAEEIELPEVEDETIEEETQEEQTAEAETEEQEENDEEVSEKEKNLLKALNRERTKRKALEQQIKGKKTEKSAYDELVKAGVDEDLAKTLANVVAKPSKDVAELRIENQILKLSKQEEFIEIENYTDEIKEFVEKGLSVEQAYYAITGGKTKKNTTAEMQRQYEAKMKNRKIKQEVLDIQPTGGNAKIVEKKNKYSPLELATASAAGMSIEEYISFKNINNANDYAKYKKK